MQRRAALPVDAARPIAVKRDVHELVVDTDARTFARAFREVVTSPDSVFGLIRVKRPAERMGLEWAVGERFQGCFSLERALLDLLAQLDAPGSDLVVLPTYTAMLALQEIVSDRGLARPYWERAA